MEVNGQWFSDNRLRIYLFVKVIILIKRVTEQDEYLWDPLDKLFINVYEVMVLSSDTVSDIYQ